jgi:PASTA domain
MTPSRSSRRAAALAAVALLTTPAFAQARDLAVTPTGSSAPGTACTTAAPCSLSRAQADAANGDRIVLGPGDYGSAASPLPYSAGSTVGSLTWVGDPGAHLYLDTTVDGDASFELYEGQVLTGNGMWIHGRDPIALRQWGFAAAERVHVINEAPADVANPEACRLDGKDANRTARGQLTNSECVVLGGGAGPTAITAIARGNDQTFQVSGTTAFSPRGGTGIAFRNQVANGGGGSSRLDLILSIADAPGGIGLDSTVDDATSRACVTTASVLVPTAASGQCGITETYGTVRTAPTYVAPLTDRRLAPGSAGINVFGTIGQTATPQAPTRDVTGDLRDPLNPEPGAYEFRAAAPSPAPTVAPISTTPDPAETSPSRQRCRVPNLLRLSYREAKRKAEKAGCRLGKVPANRRNAAKFAVIRQNRKAGTVIKFRTVITVKLGKITPDPIR